ncbi:S-methyl-5-thioribose-1-phosphate isomerase [Desulfonema magnum]|uniref:Methylthioribose-1-phosphate isomerase n=1 Tax=Desulfonema magnum TaxID=45655 RepID=A0A975BVV9_9BACT|nr:S-methyl-5-thioribose-1-phosphate isomerase [Desulfonema magnum]QTA92095.1 Methylthioribose-1-phosphate isomerase [Desulfonema magnum]
MKADEKNIRPIWFDNDSETVKIIDQRLLPHEFVITDLSTADDVIMAIKEMYVRGAPLIGVTGAYGVYLAAVHSKTEDELIRECERLKAARPTAVNLVWGVDKVLSEVLKKENVSERIDTARKEAAVIAEFEAENCRKIGEYGVSLIEAISRKKHGKPVNLLTHCNAGWLACIEYGTATAPMYAAYEKGIDIHVWVDETRPLNQGARLTAWELGRHGIQHTVITDNAGGHLMQHGMVDMVIVGTDRTTYTGDVANKIGTYLKALAAKDNNIPFYVALPSTTFDWTLRDGLAEIPIEERDPDEVRYIQGADHTSPLKACGQEISPDEIKYVQNSEQHTIRSVLVPPENSPAANYAFDVTPARLVTGFITERGSCKATEEEIKRLFPD